MWIQIQIKKQQWNERESCIDSFGFNIVYTPNIYYTRTRTSIYTYTHTYPQDAPTFKDNLTFVRFSQLPRALSASSGLADFLYSIWWL